MNSYKQKIIEIVKAHNGIKASKIASELAIDKKIVNGILYGELKAICYVDERYNWHYKRTEHAKSQSTQSADTDLEKICRYYLNCLSLDKDSSAFAFVNSDDIVEIASLTHEALSESSAQSLIQRTKKANDKIVHVGYPLLISEVYSKKTRKTYRTVIPILLFQVDLATGKIIDTPTINMKVVQVYSSGNDNTDYIHEYVALEHTLGLDNLELDIELDDIVAKMQATVLWHWKEKLDPTNLNLDKPINELDETGIYNKAALIATKQPLYTQGLEIELDKLSKISLSDYKNTALYNWIHPDTKNNELEKNTNILEVLPLNLEQRSAIEHSLNDNTTVITGPPGTGKSQVVANLLVNMAWQNKRVLFASKNNKAVDVVEIRVNELGHRPIVLRMGSDSYASRLKELIAGYLSAPKIDASEDEEYQRLKEKYDTICLECDELINKKQNYITLRNKVDMLEQKIAKNDEWRHFITQANIENTDILAQKFKEYQIASNKADKVKQGIFCKLLWQFIESSRRRNFLLATDNINAELRQFGITNLHKNINANTETEKEVTDFINYMYDLCEYRELLGELDDEETLENIDKLLLKKRELVSDIAQDLWKKWLLKTRTVPDAATRTAMTGYLSVLDLMIDKDISNSLRSNMLAITNKMAKYFPCYAITSLSVQRRIPFEPGIFDLVIVDEASQCDIASALPLLYRAKRAVIIGDPKQLSHISQIKNAQELELIDKYRVGFEWVYSQNSLYRLASAKVNAEQIINLRDHHRSHGDIINFSNKEFYDGTLRIATDYKKLKVSANSKPGVRWVDIKGKTVRPMTGSAYNHAECVGIVNELQKLVANGYKGSIGVVTPFRLQVEKIKSEIEKDRDLVNALYTNNEFLVDTVHKFQGDERDLMIFSTVISDGTLDTTLSFLRDKGNLFNVAITRARSTLLVIGNMSYCAKCAVPYLEHFVQYINHLGGPVEVERVVYPTGRDYPKVSNPESVSEWEVMFYQALYDAGISTIPQYPADKYKLDLAIIQGKAKLDIEIDGERYHRAWNGELCYRDQLRNQRLFELGWDVKRFWVYQIRDELDLCVEQIIKWVAKHKGI